MLNSNYKRCIKITKDSDIGYEDVEVGIAVNGVDYVTNSEVVYTFEGPDSGSMIFVYVLITLFTMLIVICIVALIAAYWDKIRKQFDEGRTVYAAGIPHVVERIPRYVNPALRADLQEDEGRI